MFIAKELRKKSIAEYLLYMWQIEDIIRAMGCSLPLIRKAYVSKFTDYTDEQKEGIESILKNQVSVVIGSGGTGKSTLVSALLKTLAFEWHQ